MSTILRNRQVSQSSIIFDHSVLVDVDDLIRLSLFAIILTASTGLQYIEQKRTQSRKCRKLENPAPPCQSQEHNA
jgi:hypothetical protein